MKLIPITKNEVKQLRGILGQGDIDTDGIESWTRENVFKDHLHIYILPAIHGRWARVQATVYRYMGKTEEAQDTFDVMHYAEKFPVVQK